MDGQQLYCQTHVPSQPADPDTGQHKEKLKVLFNTSYIQLEFFCLTLGPRCGRPVYEPSRSFYSNFQDNC